VIVFDGQIELLAATHDRRSFSCGEPALDDYLQCLARQHAASKISRTYVATQGAAIFGYYSLAMSAIRKDQPPEPQQKRFPNYPVPVARLARLGVDQKQQGKGLGKLLLMDALYRCYRLSEEIGSVGVVVDAKHAQAQSFYRQFNFEEFPETPLTLWLPVAAIARLFGPSPDIA
jgi:GNAT superfamily N-acetyltransferase